MRLLLFFFYCFLFKISIHIKGTLGTYSYLGGNCFET